MIDYLIAIVGFAASAVVITLTLYLITQILAWSSGKPLPGEKNPLANIAIVSTVLVIALVLILDIELTLTLQSVRESVSVLLETIDLATIIIVGGIVLIMLAVMRRISRKQRTRRSG
jgi:hypothetical protein